ncbi:hypothetical protein [Brassicibacter mesophilus]|uniref:hypothetical protein n=1 Tax=Brassicibacter mesophilus TaxID=745119 RepID=UPI003D1B4F8E
MIGRIVGAIGLIASVIAIIDKLDVIKIQIRKLKLKLERSKLFQGKKQRKMSESAKNDNDTDFDPFYEKIPGGIILRSSLKKNKRITNEVFAIELLTKDIYLDKNGESINVSIDRGDVKYAAITNRGKDNLVQEIIRKQKKTKQLTQEDKEIQSFLNNTDKSIYKKIRLKSDKKFLRWASGGIISIVEYKGKCWIPMFFRDKEPYGWNVFLGSSERSFDENGKLIHSIDEELNNPTKIMYREFDEELIVFKSEPNCDNRENVVIPISYPFYNGENSINFNEKHIKLREKYDDLNIRIDDEYIYCTQVNTNMSLQIKKHDGKMLNRLSNVLVCFNMLELGIEVVQVIKFKLDDKNVLLDGEILSYFDESKYKDELVRMPIALISCEFLKKHFTGDITKLQYTSGLNSSIKIDECIESENMMVFDYDLKQRLRVIRDEKEDAGDLEFKRYKKSFDSFFEEIYADSNTNSNNLKVCIKRDFTRYFTPATPKLLNLFFNQIDPAEYTIEEED